MEDNHDATAGGEMNLTQDPNEGLTQDPMTQEPEWSEQDLLKNQFLTDGPNSVANTAILLRNEGQDNASPEFIFLGDSIATLGSAYRSPCDIKLSKFQDHGMSNLALTFHYAEGKLSVVSSN